MAAADLPTTIGRYEVVSRLGQGGMGSLYLAKDPKIGRLVAIKLVRQEFDSPEARQRFAREAQSAGTLRHQNIVTIFDVDEHEGLPFIAMEYIDGETLGEIVKRKALLPIPRRLQWVEDLCSGLAYAHRQGVIHRDIKPANLMVDTEGTLKILDFGLARRDASKFTQSHVIIGTPNYMSPEQIRGSNLDNRSDIFSVGALMYEILTYKEAFPGAVHQTMHKILHEEPEPIEQILPGIDPGVVKVMARAMQKDRDGRYADLTAMKNDIAEVRARIEKADADDSATMPVQKTDRFKAPGSDPAARRGTPAPSSGRSGSSQAGQSKRTATNRQSLQRRRSEQITAFLDEARKKFEAGELDKAREACDQALMFDPDHPGALQLMDDIAAEADRRQVAAIIADARAEMQKGQLDRAEALVADARALAPESTDVQQLQDAIDTTRREIERTRQIQEAMRRARARFAEGNFEAGIRAASEALAIDPENAAAKDLQTRAQEAIDARNTRAERDKAANAAVAAARAQYEKGDQAGAVAALEAFTPKHDLVSAFLASLKGEAPPEPIEPVAPHVGGETAHILRGARGESENLPARRNMLIAVGTFSVLVIAALLVYRPWENAPVEVSNNTTPSFDNATAAAPPAAPAPAPEPVTPPAALVATPPTDVNGKDLMEAYRLLGTNQRDQAQTLATRIARRDKAYASQKDYKDLIAAIELHRANEEKQKLATAEAVAAATPPPPPKPSPAELKDPESPAPVATVLPGGGFAAESAPASPLLIGQVERPAVERLAQQWAAALATRNIATISKVRALTATEAKNWQNIFGSLKAYKLNVRLLSDPEVKDNEATVPVEEIAVYTQKNGIDITQQPVKTTYRMRKIGGEWRMLPPQ
ncbi:MAG: protein kinase [Vicinamibacterales bacterium]